MRSILLFAQTGRKHPPDNVLEAQSQCEDSCWLQHVPCCNIAVLKGVTDCFKRLCHYQVTSATLSIEKGLLPKDAEARKQPSSQYPIYLHRKAFTANHQEGAESAAHTMVCSFPSCRLARSKSGCNNAGNSLLFQQAHLFWVNCGLLSRRRGSILLCCLGRLRRARLLLLVPRLAPHCAKLLPKERDDLSTIHVRYVLRDGAITCPALHEHASPPKRQPLSLRMTMPRRLLLL